MSFGRRGQRGRSFRALLILSCALASRIAAAGVHVERLGRGDGLPSTQVHAVVQSADGFVWLAGPSGLVRYDGLRMVTLRTADGLSSQGLRSLALDHDDRLWIGTDVGIDVRGHDGRIRPLVGSEAWRHGFVDAMARGADRTMWIAASRGLLRWSAAAGLEPVRDPRLRDQLVTAVAADGAGNTWAAVPGVGLLRHDGRQWQQVEPAGIAAVGAVRTLALASGESVLVGGENALVELDAADQAVAVRPVTGPEDRRPISSLLRTGDELWVGAGRELRRYRRQREGWRPAELVLDNALVNDLAVDALGSVWAATDNLGVAKVSALRDAVRRVETPCASQVFAVAAGPQGTYLVAGDTCSWIMSAAGEQTRRLEALDRVKTWDLLWSRGTLWAATEEGLFRGDGDRPMARIDPVRHVEGPWEPLAAPGRAMLDDGDALWVGTVTGLVSLETGRTREHRDAEGRSLGYVYTLERDADGRIWVGTIGNGLWRQTAAGGFARVSAEHLADRGNTYSIAFGAAGKVAVAQDERLVILAGGQSRLLPRDTADAVAAWSLLFDPAGALWAGGLSGLVRYDLAPPVPTTLRLTASMGLGSDEFTTSRSLVLDAAGRLLCGLDNGLSVVDGSKLLSFREPPRVRALAVTWSNAEVRETGQGTAVRQGRWTLDVAAAALWFIDEKSLSYRHRLRGFDAEWSSPQPRGSHGIHYTGLPPGAYALEAQAHSPLVGWGPAVELLRFTVTPPWWRQSWALALWATSLAGGALGLWRWRTRVLVRRSEELEHQVEQRTAELQLALNEVEHLASHDSLTGLPNQRSFWAEARRHAALAQRHGMALALVVVDLDNFKKINDAYGHQIGDDVLIFAGQRLADVARESDMVARYGGEEFVVLLPSSSESEALRAAERLRETLASRPYVTPDGARLTVTGSFGVSSWRGPDDEVEALFHRADVAVYAAKGTKNAVAVWIPEMEDS